MIMKVRCYDCGKEMLEFRENKYGKYITYAHLCPNCDFETFSVYKKKWFGLWKHLYTIDTINSKDLIDPYSFGFIEWMWIKNEDRKKLKRIFIWTLWVLSILLGLLLFILPLYSLLFWGYSLIGIVFLSISVIAYFDIRRIK